MPTTAELQERQAAALEANAARKAKVADLQASNKRLEERVAELEAAGTDVTALKAELAVSNGLLQELQDAVLAEDAETGPADPAPVEPAPVDGATNG